MPGGDAATYVASNLSGAPYRCQARVTLRAPATQLAGRLDLWGSIEPLDEERCELRTSDDSLHWLAVRIGMLAVDFEVHEPPELVERFRALAGRFGRAAGAA